MSWYEVNATFRPISNWPGEQTDPRQRSRFDSPWSSTLRLLARELGHIVKPGATPVLEIAVRETQLRNDGYPYASARPEHPGVILNIESRWGPLRYPCDTFDDWQDNMRAIALALEALRKVDRYGVTKRGEQYAGWKALPPPAAYGPDMSVRDAAALFAETAGRDEPEVVRDIVADPAWARSVYRKAAKRAHPDHGGTDAAFARLYDAKVVLDAHHGAAL